MTNTAHQVHHDPNLAHHFENMDQQRQSSKLAMWVFLATEILFFGGLICAYVIYRSHNPDVFIFGAHFLDKNLGALNTVILICSSFTMAWAVRAAQLRQRGMLQLMLVLTLLFACGFLGVKAVEYTQKWQHGLLWAAQYNPDAHYLEEKGVVAGDHSAHDDATPATQESTPSVAETDGETELEVSKIAPAAQGPAGLATAEQLAEARAQAEHLEVKPENAKTFFSIYFLLTGLHGIHVLGGMGAMIWLLMIARRGAFDGGNFAKVDNVGLYWHLVDLIWIYLFLMLYLID